MRRESPKTILVIDDQGIARKTIRRMLEYHGYTVLEATDGREALEVFQREQAAIGLVVLDLTLPDTSGEQMLARLRVLAPQVKVAVCTDQTVSELKRQDAFREVVGILRKPVRTDRLLATVRQALEAS